MTDAPEYLTVKELAQLLRIKERKVYDLAAAGDIPCTRATGKLLFPDADVRAWIDGKQTGTLPQRPKVFLGSHDPLLEWALRQSDCGLATFFDGSLDGIDRFLKGEGIAAGLHITDPDTGDWNTPIAARDCAGSDAVLIGWAKRQRGLVCRDKSIKTLQNVVGRRIAQRKPSTGAAALWDHLLKDADIALDAVKNVEECPSEADAILAVAEDRADVTFGLEAMAHPYNLRVVPLVVERFDLLIDRAAYFEPAMQTFLKFCQTDAFRARAQSLKGYDISGLGDVRWNA